LYPEVEKSKNNICFGVLSIFKEVLEYTHSVLIRNGPIRHTSEIFGFYKKHFDYPPDSEETPLLTSHFFQSKKQQTFGICMCESYLNADQEPRRARRVDYSAIAEDNL